MNFTRLVLTSLLAWGCAAIGRGQATVAVLSQNQLWAGIENPVNITSVAPFDDVRVTGGKAIGLEFKGDRHASLHIVPNAGAESVSVAMRFGDDAVTSAAVFRVNPLPQPVARFGRAAIGDSLNAEVLASSTLRAGIPELGEDVAVVWHGFVLSTTIDGVIQHYASPNDELTTDMRRALAEAPSGAGFLFNQLAVETPDGQHHKAPNLLFFKK